MQGEMTEYGVRFECIIDGHPMIVYLFAGQYIGYPLDGGVIHSRLTEQQVVDGVCAKMAMDVEEYNQHAPQAAMSRGSYYGD